jgi:hypothetical protein
VPYVGSYPSAGVDTQGLKKDTVCVICFERDGDHVLLPCGHGGYCGACAHTLLLQPHRSRLCPICRARLGSVAKIDLNIAIGAPGNVLEASVGNMEPPGDTMDFSRWQEIMEGVMSGRAQTFPQDVPTRVERARAAAAAASDARAQAVLMMARNGVRLDGVASASEM